LQQCLRWLLGGIDWSSISFRADCGWAPKTLAAGALLWAWSDEQTLTERFRTVRKIATCLFGRQRQLAKTYQAFTKILRRWTDELIRSVSIDFMAFARIADLILLKVYDWQDWKLGALRWNLQFLRKRGAFAPNAVLHIFKVVLPRLRQSVENCLPNEVPVLDDYRMIEYIVNPIPRAQTVLGSLEKQACLFERGVMGAGI
jgi:hypothetical protein